MTAVSRGVISLFSAAIAGDHRSMAETQAKSEIKRAAVEKLYHLMYQVREAEMAGSPRGNER